jgi:hypothetical protein
MSNRITDNGILTVLNKADYRESIEANWSFDRPFLMVATKLVNENGMDAFERV